MNAPLATASIATPIGMVVLEADAQSLCSVRIRPSARAERHDAGNPLLDEAAAQLRAWFAGSLRDFSLPLVPAEGEEGARLRAAIASIPFGETCSYGALAARCGSVARAVGQACKINRFPIMIPCHRVVSSAGREYYSAGAGPETKAWLLDFESFVAHGIRRRLI